MKAAWIIVGMLIGVAFLPEKKEEAHEGDNILPPAPPEPPKPIRERVIVREYVRQRPKRHAHKPSTQKIDEVVPPQPPIDEVIPPVEEVAETVS